MVKVQLTFRNLKQLLDFGGNETCGFLVAKELEIIDVWPSPSLRSQPDSYSIGRRAWALAYKSARSQGLQIAGAIHTHPDGPPGPSEKDLQIATRLRNGLRAVWHPRSGRFTLYDRSGIIAVLDIPCPWWFRLIVPFFFG